MLLSGKLGDRLGPILINPTKVKKGFNNPGRSVESIGNGRDKIQAEIIKKGQEH